MKKKLKIGLIPGEFFSKDMGGYGGYGKLARNLASHFNATNNSNIEVVILLDIYSAREFPETRWVDDTKVILLPNKMGKKYIWNFVKYAALLRKEKIDLIITIEFYENYKYPLLALFNLPWILYIQDPRTYEDWEKIFSVELERERYKNVKQIADLTKMNIRYFNRICVVRKFLFARNPIFVSHGKCLIEKAKTIYNTHINKEIDYLPIPIPQKFNEEITKSQNPSAVFLARLDPYKRPWLFFELAKRFNNVEFFVMGQTHFPILINPIINKYKNIPNLKFLGFVDEEEKEAILNKSWVLINTSIHEGLPASFIESLSCETPILSCNNPDDLTKNFGFYTERILGDGFDQIDKFCAGLKYLLENEHERKQKGKLGKEYVHKVHSFENFETSLKKIILKHNLTNASIT